MANRVSLELSGGVMLLNPDPVDPRMRVDDISDPSVTGDVTLYIGYGPILNLADGEIYFVTGNSGPNELNPHWTYSSLSSYVKTTSEVTYAELKALRDAKGLVTGGTYLIKDFRSLWYIGDHKDPSASDWGLWVGIPEVAAKFGITLKEEPLLVWAKSETELDKVAVSPSNPTHVIHYDPIWDGPASVDTKLDMTKATTEFRGRIVFRQDPYLDISAKFDYLAVQNVRWKATADAWEDTKKYVRGTAVKIADAAGDGHYVSLKNDNTGHSPEEADSDWWVTIREKGKAESLEDYWISQTLGSPDSSIALGDATDGFIADETSFKLLYTFSIESDLTNPTGFISDWSAWYYHAHVGGQFNNVLILTKDEGRNIHLETTEAWHNTIYGEISDIKVTAGKFRRNYIRGYSKFIEATGTYIFGNILYGITKTKLIDVNYSIVTDGKMGDHQDWECIFYKTQLEGNNNIFRVPATHASDPSSISFSKLFIGETNVLKPMAHCNLNFILESHIAGELNAVTATNWGHVTIPKNVYFRDVLFTIPTWYGKNTWSGNDLDLVGVTVSRKWSDINAYNHPSKEKLWYEQIDEDGIIQLIEIK